LVSPTYFQDGVALLNGKVLIEGGQDIIDPYKGNDTAETYDPVAGVWSAELGLSNHLGPRFTPFLVRLPGGRVLAAGGTSDRQRAAAEIYDPSAVLAAWKMSSSLNKARSNATLTLLGCDASMGRVLIAGGKAYDAVTNTYPVTDTYELYDRVPTVNVKALTGLTGTTAGGTAISIKGLGFKPITPDVPGTPGTPGTISVKFGDAPAAGVTKVSDNEVTAVSPPNAASGKVDVTVTVDGVVADTCKEPFQFDYLPRLAVAGITPALGPVTGGTAVKVTGQGFTPASVVKFGDAPATKVSVNTAGDTITAETPAHDPGPVVVTITNGADTTATAFTYYPVISGIVPPNGPTGGGTSVNIAGKGLAGATRVTFGGSDAKFTVASDGAVLAESPPHTPAQVEVRIDTKAGVAVALTLAANLFTYEDTGLPLSKPSTGDALGGGAPGGSKIGPQNPGLPAGTGGGPGSGAPAAHIAPAPGSAPVSQSAPGQAPGLNPVSVQAPVAAGAPPPASQPVIQTGPAAYLERPTQPVPGAANQAMVGLSNRHDPPYGAFAAAASALMLLGACFTVSGFLKKQKDDQQDPRPAPSVVF